jgi:hypothetical protein
LETGERLGLTYPPAHDDRSRIDCKPIMGQ